MSKTTKIATVVLSYNSFSDLMILVPQLMAQKHIDNTIVIVDNKSNFECRQEIAAWLIAQSRKTLAGNFSDVLDSLIFGGHGCEKPSIICVFNEDNRGYSAGNNVGIKIAEALRADAVLIANPDIRINDPEYIEKLYETLSSSRFRLAASSKIVDLNGFDVNPQRESTFYEELFWPYQKIKSKITRGKSLLKKIPVCVQEVEKLSGCCIMIRTDFILEAGLLDENVFLYSEEAILAKKVKNFGGVMVFDPRISAIHAHQYSDAVGECNSTAVFIQSRIYYLHNYSGYSLTKISILSLSYSLMKVYIFSKSVTYKIYRRLRSSLYYLT